MTEQQAKVLPRPLDLIKYEKALKHPVIRKWLKEKKRFAVVHAGRRSFKTYISKRFIIQEAMKNKGNYFLAAPTHRQAKIIWWEDLKAMSPEWFVSVVYEQLQYIKYANGSEIWVTGLDSPARIEGKLWNGCIIDEYGNINTDIDIFARHIRPLLADTGGFCWFIGVSRSVENPYYRTLSEYARNSGDPDWGDYTWNSEDFLSEEEIVSVKSTTDEDTYKQEYLGSFVQTSGLVYSYFDKDTHVKTLSVDLRRPLFVSCDFNISPCIWLIGQIYGDNIHILKEISQRQTDTWKMVAELKKQINSLLNDDIVLAYNYRIDFVGDYTSAHRRDVSAVRSSWEIIQKEMSSYKKAEFKYQVNPRVVDRVNAVNSRLRSADGNVHFSCEPSCLYLQKDFNNITWEIAKKEYAGDLTHASDCLGYAVITLMDTKEAIISQ